MESNMNLFPEDKKELIFEMLDDLKNIRGIEGIVLGGSYARGCPSNDSDVDLGIYYSEKSLPSIDELQNLAGKFDTSDKRVVTRFYEWGPWVNGGAWLHTPIGKIDWLYRNVDQVSQVIADAKQGHFSWDFRQQPPYGFFSVMYLADAQHNIPLYDPQGILVHLKEEVKKYPEPLRRAIIQEHLWSIEFSYFNAKKLACCGCIYGTVGCITRIVSELTQVLFALNRVYFATEKGALETIETFPIRPTQYAIRINDILSYPGKEKDLIESLKKLHGIIQEVIQLSTSLYIPKYSIQ